MKWCERPCVCIELNGLSPRACYSVLQCVAVCCSVSHRTQSGVFRVCCSVKQCVAVWSRVLQSVAVCCSLLQSVAVCCIELNGLSPRVQSQMISLCISNVSPKVCCSVLQCFAVFCSVLQCVAVCCSVSQCVAVCHSVLQCVVVCCNVS